jgi:formylglycine-generating enzyme required for sulfatase activity
VAVVSKSRPSRTERVFVALVASSLGCTPRGGGAGSSGDAGIAAASIAQASPRPAVSAPAEGVAPRQGMVWVPPGVLRAGTPPDRAPRVADEEMAGSPVEMGGFYIDLLPWPNEPNAIPTTNVARDEAEQLFTSKGKRLCTELEWERACKGPSSFTYEYGDGYRKEVCGTGVALEQASRRPTGEHPQCKSGFGVTEMHGGVFEWTSSVWGRGSKDGAQGVLRAGNSVAGELAGRCANAIARAPTKKAATMGLRCCAGAKNPAEVALELKGTPGLMPAPTSVATPWISAIAAADGVAPGAIDPKSVHAWTWIPVANEELIVAIGCTTAPRACGLIVSRATPDVGAGEAATSAASVLMSVSTGRDPPELARVGDARHLRIRSLDAHGVFGRDITYAFGRVELGEPKRK